MPKLNKRVVDALKPDQKGRDVIHFDTEIPRYGVRVKPSGVKTYVLQYRNKFGQLRRLTLGRAGAGGFNDSSESHLPGQPVGQGRDRSVERHLVQRREDREHVEVDDSAEAVVGDEKRRLIGERCIDDYLEPVVAAYRFTGESARAEDGASDH